MGGGWEACEGNWEERRNIGCTVKKEQNKNKQPPQKTKFLLVLYNFEFHVFILFLW